MLCASMSLLVVAGVAVAAAGVLLKDVAPEANRTQVGVRLTGRAPIRALGSFFLRV